MVSKKRVFLRITVLLVILMQFCIGSIVVYAKTTPDGFIYQNMGSVIWISGYEGNQSDIQIPESIDGKPVTVIAAQSFYNNKVIKSVQIPSSITSIGSQAFSKCTNLTSINIPFDITEIKSMTFQGCTSLEYIELPGNIQKIGSLTFSDCTSLKSISIPVGVTVIEDSSFASCSRLDTVVIPNSVVTIEKRAFKDCIKLKQIDLPNEIVSIGTSSFENCTSLLGIELPENLTKIESRLFYGCTSLVAVDIPEKVAEIGSYAFYECSQLQAINIPESVIKINSRSFYGCANNLTIYGLAESYVATYATKNKVKFISQQENTGIVLILKAIKSDINQWEIIAIIKGEGEKAATNVKVKLNLPDSLELVEGNMEVSVGTVKQGEEKQVSWLVKEVLNEKQAYSVVALAEDSEVLIETNNLP